MADISIVWDPVTGTGDFAMSGSGLLLGNDLQTAVIISLFTDGQADPGDIVYDTDPRGWWADTYAALEDPALTPLPDDRTGSKLWQVFVRPRNQDTLNWLQDEVGKSLAWMLTDGVASSIEVQPLFTTSGGVGAIVTITANGVPTVYDFAWAQET
jgi:phage gp46-like protein